MVWRKKTAHGTGVVMNERAAVLWGGTAAVSGYNAIPPLVSTATLIGMENETNFGFLTNADAWRTLLRYSNDEDFGARFFGIEDGTARAWIDGGVGLVLLLLALIALEQTLKSFRNTNKNLVPKEQKSPE